MLNYWATNIIDCKYRRPSTYARFAIPHIFEYWIFPSTMQKIISTCNKTLPILWSKKNANYAYFSHHVKMQDEIYKKIGSWTALFRNRAKRNIHDKRVSKFIEREKKRIYLTFSPLIIIIVAVIVKRRERTRNCESLACKKTTEKKSSKRH